MIWLITQSAGWLLLTMAFAALAGWAWASERAAPAQRALRRQRETLVRDLTRLGAGELAGDSVERERESDAGRRLLEIRDGRIAELERSLAAARERADEAASRLAESERRGVTSGGDEAELSRLRALVAEHEARAAEVAAPEDEAKNLQAWRLRCFEQRVRYLEGLAPPPQPAPEPEWRAREAEARAAHLEGELRALSALREPATADESEPFAANAEVDMALRWRMLYLEKRVAHLQGAAKPEPVALPVEEGPDPEVWKWRSRYLEARVRHLEQAAPAAAVVSTVEIAAEEAPPAPQSARGVKPAVLAAPRNGLPDDFTLIEGLSGLQQSTLNALGIFHFDQIAAWTPEHVAWVDRYLYLRGRIEEEEWIEQAADLAREGVSASRRALAEEDA